MFYLFIYLFTEMSCIAFSCAPRVQLPQFAEEERREGEGKITPEKSLLFAYLSIYTVLIFHYVLPHRDKSRFFCPTILSSSICKKGETGVKCKNKIVSSVM